MDIKTSQTGMTLVELLVVITLISILLSLGSSFNNLIARAAHQSTQAELMGFIKTARTTAIMEGTNVTLCPVGANGKCSNDWSLDLVAFRDEQRLRRLTHNSQVIRTLQPPTHGNLQGNAGIRNYFGFRPTGMAREAIGNIIWCPQDGDARNAYQIRINMGGRPRLAQDTNGDGIAEDSQGQPLSC